MASMHSADQYELESYPDLLPETSIHHVNMDNPLDGNKSAPEQTAPNAHDIPSHSEPKSFDTIVDAPCRVPTQELFRDLDSISSTKTHQEVIIYNSILF